MKIPDFERERSLYKQGFSFIGGIDEVGRGCWAGPVVAGAVIIRPETVFEGKWLQIRDSKVVSQKQRELLNPFIRSQTIWAIGECGSQEIDEIGIGKATRLAMKRAVEGLSGQPDYLLLDGREVVDLPIAQLSVVDGDASVLSIAAASIIAKVYRDEVMEQYDKTYPGYGFARHVGYGTKEHVAALKQNGPCLIHRMSYKPLKVYA